MGGQACGPTSRGERSSISDGALERARLRSRVADSGSSVRRDCKGEESSKDRGGDQVS